MKVWCVKDYGGCLLADMHSVFDKMPKALPWIEPSINCLHQESVLSLLVGNSECAILSMCALMEHVLRLAVVNKEECGLRRPETMTQIDRYNSLTAIIDAAAGTDVFAGCDEDWWRSVSKNIRNKSAHYLLPTILRNCASDPNLKKYIVMEKTVGTVINLPGPNGKPLVLEDDKNYMVTPKAMDMLCKKMSVSSPQLLRTLSDAGVLATPRTNSTTYQSRTRILIPSGITQQIAVYSIDKNRLFDPTLYM